MAGEHFREVQAFLAVARERSFTRAAIGMGVSQSALSHTVRNLEERLGLRLLTRTTRNVSLTEAGERLVARVASRFDVIEEEFASLERRRDAVPGPVRIAAPEFVMSTVLWPKLQTLQLQNPDLRVEITLQPEPIDIVPDGYDAFIRHGDQVVRQMAAVKISPPIDMLIVGSPAYLAQRSVPMTDADLAQHQCINTRRNPQGQIDAWELSHQGRQIHVQIEGPWTFNSFAPVVDTALAGFGLAYVPRLLVQRYLQTGRLQSVLADWCPALPALHLCYSQKQRISSGLERVVNTLTEGLKQ